MCYVIITCRSLLWTLLSITCFMFILVSVMSPNWLIGFPRGHPNVTEPTLGIFNRCRKIYEFKIPSDINNCATYVTDFMMPDSEFPNVWKAALIFFGIALVMLMFAAIAAVLSLCVRALCGKSLFTLCGLVQSIAELGFMETVIMAEEVSSQHQSPDAEFERKHSNRRSNNTRGGEGQGLLCIIGMMLYPSGWGSPKVKDYCGKNANPFDLDQCRLGWSFYLCIVGTLATFLCAVLSIKADASTSSHKVEEEVLEGKYLICVA